MCPGPSSVMGKISKYYTPPTSESELGKLPIVKFIKFVESTYSIKIGSYSELHKWSCDCSDKFWEAVLNFAQVLLHTAYTQVIEDVSFEKIPKWFLGAKLNYAENLLYAHGTDEDDGDRIAIIEAKSDTEFTSYDYRRLRRDVVHLASSLRRRGVSSNDCVVAYVANSYETTVAALASAAIGAAWSSASVDFGTFGVLERFSQVNPTVMFAAGNASYKRKFFNLLGKVDDIVKGLPSLQYVVFLDPLKKDLSEHMKTDPRYSTFADFMGFNEETDNFEFASVPFRHPLYIMFSSGTTGPPKGMVHTTGGALLKHVEEHILQTGFTPDDVIFFYTTCGWMMWNWLMSCFFIGMTVVLYDESPLDPDRHVLLKIAARHKCTVLGMGAKIYDEFQKTGGCPASLYDLSSLRMFLSTGSPLSKASFRFLNDCVRPGAVIGSISGGTDIVGCFMGACEILPVVEGECQCAYLGLDIVAYDVDTGKSVVGEQGELVCRNPFPSMPSHFINDPDGKKYHRAYFERFDGVWAHGDFCCINPVTGGIVMLGRSDATLNRGGVRIGTAEIYSVVQTFAAVSDSLVVSQKVNESFDERIMLFVKMAPGEELTAALEVEIKRQIRSLMSPRHVPDHVQAVPDIPYTISGKKVEMAVKQIINGGKVFMRSSLRNPEALDHFLPYSTL